MSTPECWITLVCLDEKSAKAVYDEAHRPGDKHHDVELDGKNIRIKYFDKRWPLDVAEWAADNCFASDSAAARVIGGL